MQSVRFKTVSHALATRLESHIIRRQHDRSEQILRNTEVIDQDLPFKVRHEEFCDRARCMRFEILR